MPHQSQRDFPKLHHLLGGYFNQDWDYDADDWRAVIAEYKREEPRESQLDAVAEIDKLFKCQMPADELGRFAHEELLCDYLPRPDLGRPDFRGWLIEVASVLRE